MKRNWFKFVLGWAVVFLVRLIPFPIPNVEPVLATQMPFAKRFGAFGGFLFGFASIVLYDLATGKVGAWTWITGGMFGLLGVLAFSYFKDRKASRKNFLFFGVFGTLVYDVVTGLTIGPIFFGQSFAVAALGQIPFTLYHLAGNIAFSLVISPLVYRWIVADGSFAETVAERIAVSYGR